MAIKNPKVRCIMHINGKGHRIGIKIWGNFKSKQTKQKVLSSENALQCLNSEVHISTKN